MAPLRITVWNEFIHERQPGQCQQVYPDGIHQTIATFLRDRVAGSEVHTATLDEPNHGLSPERLGQTDVLFWWGHAAHDRVEDNLVDQIQQRVLAGMGLICLHSGHASKIFRRLMGTGCMLRWREASERERVWITSPGHPILQGLPEESFVIPNSEMYGEHFDIPEPVETLLISWFEGGEVFRSGVTFKRGAGRIFFFSPGHETYPIYHQEEVQLILSNAAVWAAPNLPVYRGEARHIPEMPERRHFE